VRGSGTRVGKGRKKEFERIEGATKENCSGGALKGFICSSRGHKVSPREQQSCDWGIAGAKGPGSQSLIGKLH